MKKVISLGLIGLVVLSMGAMSFAGSFGRGASASEDFERGTGIRIAMTEDEFEAYRAYNQINLSLDFETSVKTIEILSGLTGDAVETIELSDLTLHEYAEDAGVLEAFQSDVLELKEETLGLLVVDGIITQEKADFMLERMSLMDGTQPHLRLGQNGGGQGFNGHGRGFDR